MIKYEYIIKCYYFKLRTYTETGTRKNVYGEWSNVKKIKAI